MAPQKDSHRLAEVFGVSRGIPLTYVERASVDEKLVNSLTRDKHLVVFGGSKQGKTCLRKHCLSDEDYVVVQCSSSSSIAELYSAIFKEAGATVDVNEQRTVSGSYKVTVDVSAAAKAPFLGEIEGRGGGEKAGDSSDSVQSHHFEINPADPNDVIRVLGNVGFDRYIVLEDFHYLAEDVQKQIAIDLKAFHEKSALCFIVVGVWLESNRLILYNGDLAGRLIPIDADKWERDELMAVLDAGEPLLNVGFPAGLKNRLIEASQGNVGILQEATYRLCERQDVFSTAANAVTFSEALSIDDIVRDISVEQAGRYQNFLLQLVEGFQKTDLEMYRWIAHVLVSSSPRDLKAGLRTAAIHRAIEEIHPERDRLLPNNTLQALKRIRKLQHDNQVQPIILDFDANENALRVVDSGFILFVEASPKQELIDLVTNRRPGDAESAS